MTPSTLPREAADLPWHTLNCSAQPSPPWSWHSSSGRTASNSARHWRWGVTPGPGLLREAILARDRARRGGGSTEIVVLTRPRRGDFVLDDGDFAALAADVAAARDLGADGVALGVLTRSRQVDAGRTATLVEEAGPMKVTFHRAFDQVEDRSAAIELLLELGVRVPPRAEPHPPGRGVGAPRPRSAARRPRRGGRGGRDHGGIGGSLARGHGRARDPRVL